ncbi:hypothetical protein H5410_053173 [Solanum commersonii]|uniref:Uncharacterized protein n=1 Tax=Solanum commersonii TaxID=4109 RepID=A0A9J5X3N8_SOLCO|nr:hypothetical protein H5410_053173 [Solanum commersonii]
MEENRDNICVNVTERKTLFLSQLRQKRAESKRERLLHQSNSTGNLTSSTSLVSPQQGSTSITSHVATKLSSTCTANKGRNRLEVNLQNDNLLPKDYLLLKKVPNCKFCAAKRFQYESPGFCCDNGSIRLSSYTMPKVAKFVLGDSKECQHFRTYK